jgi:hypothetical protein
MREALDLLFRTGLLTWRGDEPRVRSRRYRARQTRLREQSPSEPTEEERQQSLSLLRDCTILEGTIAYKHSLSIFGPPTRLHPRLETDDSWVSCQDENLGKGE